MLYISTNFDFTISLNLEEPDGDLLPFTITDSYKNKIQILNLYNEKDDKGIKTIERKLFKTPLLRNCLLLSDFNIRYPS